MRYQFKFCTYCILFFSFFIFRVNPVFSSINLKGENLSHLKKKEFTLSIPYTQSNNSAKQSILGTIIVFLSARCPCSQDHESELIQLHKEFPLFQFIGVHSNTNEPTEEAHSYFVKQNLPFPVIQDDKSKLANQLKAAKTPHVFIVNLKAEILYSGGIDNSHSVKKATIPFLRNALLEISQGKPVTKKQTRTLGCLIQR